MSLRQRKKTFSKTVEDLDAFPKVPDSYVVEQEASNAIGNVFQITTTSRKKEILLILND